MVVPAYREEARIADTVTRIRPNSTCSPTTSRSSWSTTARRMAPPTLLDAPVRTRWSSSRRTTERALRCGPVCSPPGAGRSVTDADLAYSPHQLVAFVEAIEGGYDVAIGNRHHADTDTLVGTSAVRSFGSRVVNMATSLMLLGNYRDTQCGCKAFRADAGRIVMGAGTIDGFAFDIEVLHLVERYGLSMIELPVEVVNSDTSTVRALRDGAGVLLDILRIRRLSQQARYPQRAANALPIEAGRPMMGMSDDAELTDPHMTPEAEPDR